MPNNPRTIDLFCGAGGGSWGARLAGAKITAGFDSWSTAGRVFTDNFPSASFFSGRLEHRRPAALAKRLGRVDLIISSPECTNHSPARGAAPRSERSRLTAFETVRFARALLPRWILIENVVSMKRWARYGDLLGNLRRLGYQIREQTINATDLGVATSRRRLFLLCDRKGEPGEVKRRAGSRVRTASEIIDWSGSYGFTPLRRPGRAKGTLERAQRAISALGTRAPFLLVYYGSDASGGWQQIDAPLRTITTLDRFALVVPTARGHMMRMLQVPELKAAMGLPKRFRMEHGTRRDQIRMVGNAVCPPVMRSAVAALMRKG